MSPDFAAAAADGREEEEDEGQNPSLEAMEAARKELEGKEKAKEEAKKVGGGPGFRTRGLGF